MLATSGWHAGELRTVGWLAINLGETHFADRESLM
jgi:hypothetical protein